MALFVPVVIGQSDYFGFGFSTVIWKPLLRKTVIPFTIRAAMIFLICRSLKDKKARHSNPYPELTLGFFTKLLLLSHQEMENVHEWSDMIEC